MKLIDYKDLKDISGGGILHCKLFGIENNYVCKRDFFLYYTKLGYCEEAIKLFLHSAKYKCTYLVFLDNDINESGPNKVVAWNLTSYEDAKFFDNLYNGKCSESFINQSY